MITLWKGSIAYANIRISNIERNRSAVDCNRILKTNITTPFSITIWKTVNISLKLKCGQSANQILRRCFYAHHATGFTKNEGRLAVTGITVEAIDKRDLICKKMMICGLEDARGSRS